MSASAPEEDLDRCERRILRSLVSRTPEERFPSDNYTATDFGKLRFSAEGEKLLDRIRELWERFHQPPTLDQLRERAERDGERASLLYLDEVQSEQPAWAAGYLEAVRDWAEAHGRLRLRQSINRMARIAEDGETVREGDRTVERKGVEEAVLTGLHDLVEIQQLANPRTRPVGKADAAAMLAADYREKQENQGLAVGLTTGIPEIDRATGGMRPGELWLLAAFTSQGKTSQALNWIERWITFGHRGLIVSVEMTVKQIWQILACIHSANPKFGRPHPLNYEQLKAGTLSPEDQLFYFQEVLSSLYDLPGDVEVVPQTERMTVAEIRTRAEIENRREKIDFVVIDYLGLLDPPPEKGVRFQSKGDRVNANIIAAKRLAMEFDNGAGIPVLSPHQVNRAGFRNAAQAGGRYELEAMADANEAERTSDNIFAIFQDRAEREQRTALLTHLKNRDGPLVPQAPFEIATIPESRVMRSPLVEAGTIDDLLDA